MDERSGLLLHQLLRAHHNAVSAALGARGLRDIGSPRLLWELSTFPDDPAQAPTQKELADRLHSAPPTIAASLKALERQGYVERRTDQRDTRRNRVAITRKGRDAIQSGMAAFQQVDDYMYHGFSPQEREMMSGLLQRMLENLYQIGGNRRAEPPKDLLGPPLPLPGTPEEF